MAGSRSGRTWASDLTDRLELPPEMRSAAPAPAPRAGIAAAEALEIGRCLRRFIEEP